MRKEKIGGLRGCRVAIGAAVAQNDGGRRRINGIECPDYEFLLTFVAVKSRIRVRKDSVLLAMNLSVHAPTCPVKCADCRGGLM